MQQIFLPIEFRETFAMKQRGDRKLYTRNCASHSTACSWYWLPFRDWLDAVLTEIFEKFCGNFWFESVKFPSEWAALCILLSSSPSSGIRVEVAGSFSFFSNGLLAITQSQVDSCVTVYNEATLSGRSINFTEKSKPPCTLKMVALSSLFSYFSWKYPSSDKSINQRTINYSESNRGKPENDRVHRASLGVAPDSLYVDVQRRKFKNFRLIFKFWP